MNSYYNNFKTNFQSVYGQEQNQNNFPSKKMFNYSFENQILKEISQCTYQVLSKKEIANRYGLNNIPINNMIIGSNFIVTIQSKWNETKPTQLEIINFIKATQQISQLENKCYLGIYLSKFSIGIESQLMFDQENLSPTNKFISIYSPSQSQLTYQLQSLLYSYQIYYYEPDGSTIMLE